MATNDGTYQGAVGTKPGDRFAALGAQQAAAVGAKVGPDGYWYDLTDGHRLTRDEADQRTQKAGVGHSDDTSYNQGGWLGSLLGRNGPAVGGVLKAGTIAAATAAGGAVAGPLLGGAAGGATSKVGAQKPATSPLIPPANAPTDGSYNPYDDPSSTGTDPFATDPTTGTTALPPQPGGDPGTTGLPGIGALGKAALGGKGGATGATGSGTPWWQTALMGAQALNTANLTKQSTDYAQQALKTSQDWWDQRAPLRTAGLAGMTTGNVLPDVSAIDALRVRGNPYAAGSAGLGVTK